MGFAEELADLDQMRRDGASPDEAAHAFPVEVLQRVGYYGPAAGAADAFNKLSQGLDMAMVRVVSARPGLDSVLATMRACTPEQVENS